MPPLWKIKREALRILGQIKDFPRRIYERYINTPYYDWILSQQIKTTSGSVVPNKRFAVYLIFPSSGLQLSHLHALSYMTDNGFTPLVVTNVPLSENDKRRVLEKCWVLIERPNFGYDFGGYRDAMLHLEARRSEIEKLAIFNDSAWFPIPNTSNWLEQAEALNVDYAAAASNYGADRVEHDHYRDLEWNYSSSPRRFHYCSFALLISKNILEDNRFWRFWKKFKLTNDKHLTVTRGEIGLSQWVIRKGFTHASTLEVFDLDKELARLDDNRLAIVFERLMIPAHEPLLNIKNDIADLVRNRGAEWRDHAEKLILLTVARQGVSYSLAELTMNEFEFPFLKKSPVLLNRQCANITGHIIGDWPGIEGTGIPEEYAALDRKRTQRDSA